MLLRSYRAFSAVFLATCCLLLAVGCGLPGPPQPPSLELPEPVGDLAAERTENTVRLTWTSPASNTDGTAVRMPVTVEICRRVPPATDCVPVGHIAAQPGSAQQYSDNLSPELASGDPRIADYAVRLKNRHGRLSGDSDLARVALGTAPPQVSALTARYTADGVLLEWKTQPVASVEYRISRREMGSGEKEQPQLLTFQGAADHVYDSSAARNVTYSYSVQAVFRDRLMDAEGAHYLEIAGNVAGPVEVVTKDVFPPKAPAGLVAIGGADSGKPYIDLSWEPNAESDLAGYRVFRRSAGAEWQPLTPSPIVATTFRDSGVEPGHSYSYQVRAVDSSGNASQPSGVTEETAP